MTDDDQAPRRDMEVDREEDLELEDDRSAEVQAGTGVPGNIKYGDITLKKGQTSSGP